jgi:hypothetical protein
MPLDTVGTEPYAQANRLLPLHRPIVSVDRESSVLFEIDPPRRWRIACGTLRRKLDISGRHQSDREWILLRAPIELALMALQPFNHHDRASSESGQPSNSAATLMDARGETMKVFCHAKRARTHAPIADGMVYCAPAERCNLPYADLPRGRSRWDDAR